MKGTIVRSFLFVLLLASIAYCSNNVRDVEEDYEESTFFSLNSNYYYPSIPSIDISSFVVGVGNSGPIKYLYLSLGLSLLGENPQFEIPAKSVWNTNFFNDPSYYGGSVAVLTQGYTIVDGEIVLSSSASTVTPFLFTLLFVMSICLYLQ